MSPKAHPSSDPSRDARASAFARALADSLRAHKILHRFLAEAAGVSVHTVASWTRTDGPKIPAGDTLRQIVLFLEHRQRGAGRQNPCTGDPR